MTLFPLEHRAGSFGAAYAGWEENPDHLRRTWAAQRRQLVMVVVWAGPWASKFMIRSHLC